ncbi:hypothetical protein [Paenibacillus sp. NPDC057967]|uniref:hypothetical protein n=1 Tax=Paenibacillus sp. NPDC057967 TaxID=3346293 RepID=UPI0036DDA16A
MTKIFGFRELSSPIHLHTAALDNDIILAFQNGELIGSGHIEEITDTTVKIGGEIFLRDNCTFVYAK